MIILVSSELERPVTIYHSSFTPRHSLAIASALRLSARIDQFITSCALVVLRCSISFYIEFDFKPMRYFKSVSFIVRNVCAPSNCWMQWCGNAWNPSGFESNASTWYSGIDDTAPNGNNQNSWITSAHLFTVAIQKCPNASQLTTLVYGKMARFYFWSIDCYKLRLLRLLVVAVPCRFCSGASCHHERPCRPAKNTTITLLLSLCCIE